MEGNLSITISAIEDLIKRMLEEKKELLHVKPKVFFNKSGVTVIIRSDLNANVNLYSLNRVIQEQVKEKVQSLLGDDPDINIKLEIRKMTVINNKKGQERPEPEIPFRYY
jgi:transcriptional regulatory protein LevR